MFEWLIREMASVKTPKFFLVDGPLSAEERTAIDASRAPLAPSYYEFIFRFGNARLYRTGSQYRVHVTASPTVEQSNDDVRICFGNGDDTVAYFKQSLLQDGTECPVFEWSHAANTEKRTANGFEEWLAAVCARAKSHYSKREWREIEEGPTPFSELELAIVEARRMFRWRVIGITEIGSIQFEVHNGSTLVLPYLSIGIRGKRRGTTSELHGGVWLPVSGIAPGETGVIEKECYVDWVDPNDVITFERPDPAPEDRDRYWEFKRME